ncbi:MAG TPA: Gfo/Idh/MocA family oxidoreductase [Candidatus Kapabacteria bacterium]|nr:Gfo/Idh/MocA family oxidoreductase [Candidatus Kapabacteria bacterium]
MPHIAILGCGLIGETHARCLAELGTPPTLFVDTNLACAEKLAAEFSGKAMDDPITAIESPNVDAVYICTYHDTHAPLAIAAAKAGKHIFLEKPMAITEGDCRAIATAVKEAGVLCMTGFKLHYCSHARKAKALIKNPQVLSAQVMDRRWPDDSWANDPLKGGGNVLSQGCHAVEMLCYLADSKPIRIFAEGGNLRHPKLGTGFADTMAATLSFENGAVATLLIGDAGETLRDGKFNFQSMNGVQSVHLYHRLTELSYFDGEREQIFSAEEDGFLNENREFLSAIMEGRKPETSEIDGFLAEMILLRGIESIRTGLPIALKDLP